MLIKFYGLHFLLMMNNNLLVTSGFSQHVSVLILKQRKFLERLRKELLSLVHPTGQTVFVHRVNF